MLHGYTQLVLRRTAADGIRPADLLFAHIHFNGNVLSRKKPVGVFQMRRYIEGYRNTFRRFAPDVPNGKRMKMAQKASALKRKHN